MTKEPKEQQTIDGAADKPSRRVKAAAGTYAKALYQRMQLQEDEAVMKPVLDKVMDEDGVEKIEVTFRVGEGEKAETLRYEVKRNDVAATSKITCRKLGDGSE